MATAALKKKIKALVEKETNVRKLELVYALLTEGTSEVAEPAVPYAAAQKRMEGTDRDTSEVRGMKDAIATSEREFAAGKGIPLEQFEQEMDAMLDEIFADVPRDGAVDPKDASLSRTKRKRS